MKIGIIGAGHIGGTLTRKLTELGHDVVVANSRGPESLAGLAAETGATAGDVREAAHAGEVVIVSIPEGAVTDLPRDLFADVRRDVVVVDTGNYYPRERDGKIDEIERGTTESRWVERQLGHDVVKAFNTMHAADLMNMGKPEGSKDRLALPVAGDDSNAKLVVMRLIDELGFDAVDDGGLDDSWRQEPGTPVYGARLDAEGVRHALDEAATNNRRAQGRSSG